MKEEDMKDINAVPVVVALFIMALLMYGLIINPHNKTSDKVKRIAEDKKAYCPQSYSVQKGDGVFAFDRLVPMSKVIVDVKYVDSKKLITKDDVLYKTYDCEQITVKEN